MQAPRLSLSSHTVALAGETDFAGWRDAARRLALEGVEPDDVEWVVSKSDGSGPPPLTPPHKGEGELPHPECPSPLWGGVRGGGKPTSQGQKTPLTVPRAFIERDVLAG